MGSLLSLVTGWKGYAAVAALCLFAGSFGTYKVMHNANLAEQTVQAKKTIQTVEHRNTITFDVGMKFEQVRLVNTQAVEKRYEEVKSHVTPKADGLCPITFGFIRVFNDSAHGPIPDASAGPDDTPSGVALSDVAKATVLNNGQYDQLAAQLIALQDWVKQQQAVKP